MRMIFLAMLPLTACTDVSGAGGLWGSGERIARNYVLSNFSEIDVRGPDKVDVRVGVDFSVRAEGPKELVDRLRITRDGEALRIDRKPDDLFHWGSGADKVAVHVTMPLITSARLAGSGDIAIDHVQNDSFTASGEGSGDISIGQVSVDRATLSISGSGNVRASGRAASLIISVAGSGDVDAAAVKAGTAQVSVAGSGNVRAAVDGPATVSVMGSGDVDLGPKARCSTSVAGSGTISCGS